MDKPERDGHLAHLREKILPLSKLVVQDKVDELRGKDFETFKNALTGVANDTLEGLIFDRGLPDRSMMDADLLDRVFFLMAGEFNSVLPLDYPYAFGVVRVPGFASFQFVAIKRNKIPGWLDWLTKGSVPVFMQADTAPGEPNLYKFLSTFVPEAGEDFPPAE